MPAVLLDALDRIVKGIRHIDTCLLAANVVHENNEYSYTVRCLNFSKSHLETTHKSCTTLLEIIGKLESQDSLNDINKNDLVDYLKELAIRRAKNINEYIGILGVQ